MYPDRKVVLILHGHGNGWEPSGDAPKARSIMPDDGTGKVISATELGEGLRQAGEPVDLLYMISCLMNNLETLGEIQGGARYVLASTTSVWNYMDVGLLVELLQEGNSVPVVAAKYGRAQLNFWSQKSKTMDMVLTDMSQFPKMIKALKPFVNEVLRSYEEPYTNITVLGNKEELHFTQDMKLGECYEKISTYAFRISEYCPLLVDIKDYAEQMAILSGNIKLAPIVRQLNEAIGEARVWHEHTANGAMDYSYSVSCLGKVEWDINGFEKAGYESLVFDRTTGWSRMLKKMNTQVFRVDQGELYETDETGKEFLTATFGFEYNEGHLKKYHYRDYQKGEMGKLITVTKVEDGMDILSEDGIKGSIKKKEWDETGWATRIEYVFGDKRKEITVGYNDNGLLAVMRVVSSGEEPMEMNVEYKGDDVRIETKQGDKITVEKGTFEFYGSDGVDINALLGRYPAMDLLQGLMAYWGYNTRYWMTARMQDEEVSIERDQRQLITDITVRKRGVHRVKRLKLRYIGLPYK